MNKNQKFQVNVRANVNEPHRCCKEYKQSDDQFEYGYYDHSFLWQRYKHFCKNCVTPNFFQDAAERIKQENASNSFELHYLNQGFCDSQPEFITEEFIQNFLIM